MAGAKASALLLYQVCAGSESVGRSFAAGLFLVLKRAELIDAGAMDVLKAWEDGVWRCDIWSVCVRCSSDPGVWLV
jgi:hypothetical protein